VTFFTCFCVVCVIVGGEAGKLGEKIENKKISMNENRRIAVGSKTSKHMLIIGV